MVTAEREFRKNKNKIKIIQTCMKWEKRLWQKCVMKYSLNLYTYTVKDYLQTIFLWRGLDIFYNQDT